VRRLAVVLGLCLSIFRCGTSGAALGEEPEIAAAGQKAPPSPAAGLSADHNAPPADSLLNHARRELWAGREEAAIPIFRRYLHRRPEDAGARLDLARALAWSGRYSESIGAYHGILADSPADPAALSGMADVLSWSGRKAEAYRLYNQAFRRDPSDPHLVQARERLAAEAEPVLLTEGEAFSDSGRLRATCSQLRYYGGEALAFSPAARVFTEQLEGETEAGRTRVVGGGVAVGAGGLLGRGWTGSGEIGVSKFGGAGARTWSQASVSFRSLHGFSLSLLHDFRDRGWDLRSLDARSHGITGHGLSLSGYLAFSQSGGLFARVRGGDLSDGNRYRGGDLSADRRLYQAEGRRWLPLARGALGLYAMDYNLDPGGYYAPSGEWAASAILLLTCLKSEHLEGLITLIGGRAGNSDGEGQVRGAHLRCVFRPRPSFSLEAGFAYDQTLQTSTYISRQTQAGLRLSL